MDKKTLTLDDFREITEQLIKGDRISSPDDSCGYLDTLDKLGQMSDEELLKAKLYADLGLDSIDIWEMVCMIECEYDVYIDDEVEKAFGTGVNTTVERFLEAVNTYQS